MPRPPRSALVVGLLLLTLSLAGVLAYQAQDAAHRHRAAAESALRDYAAFAGEEYAARMEAVLDERTIHKVLWAALAVGDTLVDPPQVFLRTAVHKGYHGAVETGPLFAVDLGTGEVWSPERPLPESV
ncbi:MAG TPA: hypothetical protein VHG51_02770, partial [Longimicrobiaceae bacterium]|nr:hypothetical protein [Longimicrobiaceae bacterium]